MSICKHCGKEFIPKAADRTTYCSRECAFEYKKVNAKGKKPYTPRPLHNAICVVCGKEFKTHQTAKAKYCPDGDCRRLASVQRAYEKNTAKQRQCKYCGIDFIPKHRASTYAYCCDEHKQLAQKERGIPQRRLHKGGISKAKRQRIYVRDNYYCKLCGKELRMDKADTTWQGNPHPLAPTVDHIVPKSIAKQLGWSKQQMNAESNLQAAHFICNVSKGNREAQGELYLFG